MLVVSINKKPIEKCGEVLCAVFRQVFFVPHESVSSCGPSSAARFLPFSWRREKKARKDTRLTDKLGIGKNAQQLAERGKREYRIKKSELGGASSSS